MKDGSFLKDEGQRAQTIMKTLVECPFCEARFQIDREQLGVQGKCQKCCRFFTFKGLRRPNKDDKADQRTRSNGDPDIVDGQ